MSAMDENRDGNAVDMRVVGDLEPKDMTRAQARLRISKAVGLNKNHETPFGKRHLLSIYWYLNGETPCPKKVIGTQQSPHIGALRAKIAKTVGFEYEYTYRDDDGSQIPRSERNDAPFRLDQLQALTETVVNTRDNRPKPSG